MQVNKNIEKPSYVLGLPMQEFIFLAVYFFGLIILNNLVKAFGLTLTGWFWLFLIITTWALYLILKWGARQNYPGFLFSYFSFTLKQPKKIEIKRTKIKVVK